MVAHKLIRNPITYMPKDIEIGRFVLDTLQIFFPWDDDLYTELKKKGFGSGPSKTLPLVYTDNTEVTKGVREAKRKYVIRPELFGKTYAELGWQQTEKAGEPIIPAEKPLLDVKIIFKDKIPFLKFSFVPVVNGKAEYHLEYSSMAAFGKLYSNWAAFYMSPSGFKTIIEKTAQILKIAVPELINGEVITEKQQDQREEMNYIILPVDSYKFCLQSFDFETDFLRNNGVKGEIPCVCFDSSEASHTAILEPYIKLGLVHTTSALGFDERKPQMVIKIAQDKMTTSQRGKKAKVKGKLIYEAEHDSCVVVDATKFALAGMKLLNYSKVEYSQH